MRGDGVVEGSKLVLIPPGEVPDVMNLDIFHAYPTIGFWAAAGQKWGFPFETWPGPYNIAMRCCASKWSVGVMMG